MSIVYASPEYVSTLSTSTPVERPRPGRLRAAGLPARQAPAARGHHRLPARPPARDQRPQRVHRVQARGQRLRDGRARDALPRPGHPRRLRRAVPELPPRLLRLLRARWRRRTRRSRSASTSAARGARRRAPVPHLLRRVRRRSAIAMAGAEDQLGPARARRGRGRPARPPARRPRRGGAAAHLRAAAVLRGLPARPRVHRGARHHRPHLRDLPRRLPDELDRGDGGRLRRRGPRADPRALRRLLYCGEWIESHALHVFFLHGPDYLGYDSAFAMARDHRAIVERALQLKKAGNALMRVVGGREIHPVNVRVGGFYRAPAPGELAAVAEELEVAREFALEAVAGPPDCRAPTSRRTSSSSPCGRPGSYAIERAARVQRRPRPRARRVRRSTSPSTRSRTRPRCTRGCATAGRTSPGRSPATR